MQSLSFSLFCSTKMQVRQHKYKNKSYELFFFGFTTFPKVVNSVVFSPVSPGSWWCLCIEGNGSLKCVPNELFRYNVWKSCVSHISESCGSALLQQQQQQQCDLKINAAQQGSADYRISFSEKKHVFFYQHMLLTCWGLRVHHFRVRDYIWAGCCLLLHPSGLKVMVASAALHEGKAFKWRPWMFLL